MALSIMIAGVFLGRLFRRGFKLSLSISIMAVISLLLFFLGLELGYNDKLVSQFASLGVTAMVIALFAVLGSCIAALFFFRLTVGRREKNG